MKKRISKKHKIYIIIITFVIIIIGSLFIFQNEIEQEMENIKIDRYNFGQLEKAKPVLETIKKGDSKFNSLKEFNTIYNVNIMPIKNCYDISYYNGDYPYIFGFQLESFIYKTIYKTKYYAYPKYDILYQNSCMGGPGGGCFDINRKIFERTISNPCKN